MLYVDIEKKLPRFSLKASFSCENGSMALFGASGAGKSLTLKCIAGIEKPDSGIIRLNDRVLFDSGKGIDLPPQKRHVGYLFQDYALFPNMTVKQNILTGLRHAPRKEREQKAREYLRRFHLEDSQNKRPDILSGGEKQRVALARIFASAPDVLLLDEPFSSLDTGLKLELIPYIKKIIDDFDGETILVSHNIDEVMRLCGSITPINDGSTQKTKRIHEFYHEIQTQYIKAGILLPEYQDEG